MSLLKAFQNSSKEEFFIISRRSHFFATLLDSVRSIACLALSLVAVYEREVDDQSIVAGVPVCCMQVSLVIVDECARALLSTDHTNDLDDSIAVLFYECVHWALLGSIVFVSNFVCVIKSILRSRFDEASFYGALRGESSRRCYEWYVAALSNDKSLTQACNVF